jgi:hypothetical protein
MKKDQIRNKTDHQELKKAVPTINDHAVCFGKPNLVWMFVVCFYFDLRENRKGEDQILY